MKSLLELTKSLRGDLPISTVIWIKSFVTLLVNAEDAVGG